MVHDVTALVGGMRSPVSRMRACDVCVGRTGLHLGHEGVGRRDGGIRYGNPLPHASLRHRAGTNHTLIIHDMRSRFVEMD